MSALPQLALSIRQPWAWAIINAGKDIENRSWPTKQRGPICIHAAKGMTKDEYSDANRFIQRNVGAVDQVWLNRWLGVTAAEFLLDRGGIIGTAEIVDCVEASDSPWFFGTYGFVLRNVQPVEFIPVKGALGFFDWRKQMVAA
ncbi:ASCH domain-containing protein [Cypionkella sp.]|uniref:ASCH domain-containing protein n=1 Tax=Cypionkella sp. TaxID=2811411 RepID=UPI00271B9B42|nr:ASCH domain-containing protein [Cypionkella sp.]MDO8982997.1 ASCH domain-containing protein [Cypionkella sp.]